MSRTAQQLAAITEKVRGLARSAPSLFSGTVPRGTLADPITNSVREKVKAAGRKINPLASPKPIPKSAKKEK